MPDQSSATATWTSVAALICFGLAYAAAVLEERFHVRKSVPVLIGAGLVWVLVGLAYTVAGHPAAAAEVAQHTLLEYAQLLLFLIPAMTYVNTLEDRGVFDALRGWLIRRRLSLRAAFWVTGALAFVISPVADNLTTALLMGGVAVVVGQGKPGFVVPACVNVVVAANAGGAFSPFGDITTLMVWQAGVVDFAEFFALLLPSLVNWLVPALLLSRATPTGLPEVTHERLVLEPGALPVLALFLATIATTVVLHSTLDLPPPLGMMLGLGALKGYSYFFNLHHGPAIEASIDELDEVFAEPELEDAEPLTARREGEAVAVANAQAPGETVVAVNRIIPPRAARPLDIFSLLERIEWDTLMFFYGVVLGIGGLGALGYLALTAQLLYVGLGPTAANTLVGLLSAVVDNVPVMFAVLQMHPEMSHGQWLLVTLTTGVGGSLLSVGSAAGVALMGQARGVYTFMAHLRWTWAIALGYAASIGTHLVVNGSHF